MLIASSAISTGVDGLQHVSSTLVVNVLPWTHAEFEQLKGRVWRQGQHADRVRVVVPVTWAEVDGVRWSWCEQKLERIAFKRSVADAVLDGAIPEGRLESPEQMHRRAIGWLARLTERARAEGGSRKEGCPRAADRDGDDADGEVLVEGGR